MYFQKSKLTKINFSQKKNREDSTQDAWACVYGLWTDVIASPVNPPSAAMHLLFEIFQKVEILFDHCCIWQSMQSIIKGESNSGSNATSSNCSAWLGHLIS